MHSFETTIVNRIGLHARPASIFVREAMKFESEIKVYSKGKAYNGKSLLNILAMGATKGTKIKIEAQGTDEVQAVRHLIRLVEDAFGEQ